MIFNSDVFIWAVAIGALAELIFMKHPTKYKQWAGGIAVVAAAIALALVPFGQLPQYLLPLFGFGIAKAGKVLGEWVLQPAIESAVYWYRGMIERWEITPQMQVDELQDPPMTESEKI